MDSLVPLLGATGLLVEGICGLLLMDKGIRQSAMSFAKSAVVVIEQPLFLTAIAILAGLVGVFVFTPVLAICGILFIAGLHRSKVLQGKPKLQVQLPVYLVVLIAASIGLVLIGTLLKKAVHIPSASEIAKSVVQLLAPTSMPVTSPARANLGKEQSAPQDPVTTKEQSYTPQVKLLFKASNRFTEERKMRIQREVDAYFGYLGSIGFDKPKELPPIGIAHGKVSMQSGIYPGTIYSEEIMLPEVYIDNPQHVPPPFSIYLFGKFFNPDPLVFKKGYPMLSAIVFSNYYLADFGNTAPEVPRPDAPADKWVSAMWDIRKKYGREFVNKSLFYAFKQWDVPVEDVNHENFDSYFGLRFGIGLRVEDNMQEHLEGVAQILKARGISD